MSPREARAGRRETCGPRAASAALLALMAAAALLAAVQPLASLTAAARVVRGSEGFAVRSMKPTNEIVVKNSAEDGCFYFCALAACAHPRDAEAADACAVRAVALRDGAAVLEYVTPLVELPSTLVRPQGPFQFRAVTSARACALRGTSVLVVNYQQHIPHFAEGLFLALSGMLSGDGGSVCRVGEPCRLLFHQYEEWPERSNIEWQQSALEVAQRAVPHAPKALNPDLFNVGEASRSAELMPGCAAGGLAFERLVLLHPRAANAWFRSAPHACSEFRRAALRLHVDASPNATDGMPGGGALAFLVRRGSRFISNGGEVQAAMRARFGKPVREISFEGFSFAEQVRALHDVRLLVAPHGTALTNLVFMPPGSAVVEVFPLYWRPADYFDALAESCGVWHGAYQNEDSTAAELDASCRETFGDTLPPLTNCTSRERCVSCGKQSATRVDIVKIDVLLAEAQAHIQRASQRAA